MDVESKARGLIAEGSGWCRCVVGDCRRECGMEVEGDTWELDGVRHSCTHADGQSDGDEL